MIRSHIYAKSTSPHACFWDVPQVNEAQIIIDCRRIGKVTVQEYLTSYKQLPRVAGIVWPRCEESKRDSDIRFSKEEEMLVDGVGKFRAGKWKDILM